MDLLLTYRNNEQYAKCIKKYIADLDDIKDDHDFIAKTSSLSFLDAVSLYDDLFFLIWKKQSKKDVYQLILEMDIRFGLRIMENDMSELNPDDFCEKYFNDFKSFLLSKNKTIRKGRIFYRARKGCYNIPVKDKSGFDNLYEYPYFGKDIQNPPIHIAKDERFNKHHFSYLYLASDVQTAIAESKPEVGEICSVGKFIVEKKSMLLDLGKCRTFEDIVLRPSLSNWKVYYFSQLVADVAKKCGFDGIVYRSVQTNGKCIVLFEPSNAQFQLYSEQMVRIRPSKVLYSNLNETKENTSFIVKGNAKYTEFPPIQFEDSVLKYIESNNDVKDLFDK